MAKLVKRLLLGLFIVLILIIGGLLVAPQFIPVETYKQQAIALGESATGRRIRVNGEVKLQFLPNIQLTLGDVRIGNPKDFGANADKDMIALKELQLSLGLWELLDRKISVQRFELVEPVVVLEKNAKGKVNWEFPSKAVAEKPSAGGDQKKVMQFQLPALSITDGTFSYAAPGAETVNLSGLNAKIEVPGIDKPAVIALDTLYGKNLPVKITAKISTPQTWLDGKETQVALDGTVGTDAAKTNLQFSGKAQQAKEGKIGANGVLKADSASLKALSKALEKPIMPDSLQGEGKLAFSAQVNYQDLSLGLKDIALALDKQQLNGSAKVNLGGSVPVIQADLTSPGVLVVADLLTPAPKEAEGQKPQISSDATDQAGWSLEPIMQDTEILKSAQTDITLRLGGLQYDTIKAGAIALHVVLKQGNLVLTLPDFDFYEGKANVMVTVSPSGKREIAVTKKTSLNNINVGAFLKEAYGFDKLTGKGTINASTRTNGVSLHDFVNRLDGNGSIVMRDGAIKGINLAETVRNAKNLLNVAKGKTTEANTGIQTDFSELSGSFTIDQGIVSNKDLALKAPLLDVTGAGTVNLPQKRVDYRLKPTLVATIEGQGRTEGHNGLTVPLRVTGTFDKLSFMPDAENLIQDILKDPKAAQQNIKDNIQGLKSLFKGL